MVDLIKQVMLTVSRSVLDKMGYAIKPKGEGYLEATAILKGAKAENLNLAEYLEKNDIGGVGRKRDDVIGALRNRGAVEQCEAILEIGAGTGIYLEKFIEICAPKKYEVYETNLGWANYLKEKFNQSTDLKVHNADGYSLKYTENNSIDTVTAHGVFVYLPIIITFQYLKETVRVCKKNGCIIFDCFSDEMFTADEILRFREINPHYDFPVVVPEKVLFDFFERFGLVVESKFNVPYHSSCSTYYILRKT